MPPVYWVDDGRAILDTTTVDGFKVGMQVLIVHHLMAPEAIRTAHRVGMAAYLATAMEEQVVKLPRGQEIGAERPRVCAIQPRS
jgi:hypothetical protein